MGLMVCKMWVILLDNWFFVRVCIIFLVDIKLCFLMYVLYFFFIEGLVVFAMVFVIFVLWVRLLLVVFIIVTVFILVMFFRRIVIFRELV